jgi:hypothetical protein
MKQKLVMLSVALLAAVVMNSAAQTNTYYWGSSGGLWSTPGNWNAGVPTALDGAYNIWGGNLVVVDAAAFAAKVYVSHDSTARVSVVSGGSLSAGALEIGNAGATGVGILSVDGGSLNVSGNSDIGLFGTARTGQVELNSGSITSGGNMVMGGWNAGATGRMTVNDGTYTQTGGTLTLGRTGSGTLVMNGGTVDLTAGGWNPLRVGSSSGDGIVTLNGGLLITSGFEADWNNVDAGLAKIELNGGQLQVEGNFGSAFRLDDNAEMAFGDDGVFAWNGNHVAEFGAAVDGGYITWDSAGTDMLTENWDASWANGTSVLYADYDDVNPGYTTVWATVIPEPASVGLLAIGGSLLFIRRLIVRD